MNVSNTSKLSSKRILAVLFRPFKRISIMYNQEVIFINQCERNMKHINNFSENAFHISLCISLRQMFMDPWNTFFLLKNNNWCHADFF